MGILLLLSACGLQGRAQVCSKLSSERFAVPSIVAPTPIAIELNRVFEMTVLSKDVEDVPGLTTQFSIASVTLTNAAGPIDFVHTARLEVLAPASTSLPTHEVASLVPASGASTVTFEGNDFDVVPYLSQGVLRYGVALSATMPTTGVQLDIETCAAVSAQFNYLP